MYGESLLAATGSPAHVNLNSEPPAAPRIQLAPLSTRPFRSLRFITRSRRRNIFDARIDRFELGGDKPETLGTSDFWPSPDSPSATPLPALSASFPSSNQPGANEYVPPSIVHAYADVYDRPSPLIDYDLSALDQEYSSPLHLPFRSQTPRSFSEWYVLLVEACMVRTVPAENTLGFSPPLAHLPLSSTNTRDATAADEDKSDDASLFPRLIDGMLAFSDHPSLVSQNHATSPRLSPLDINSGSSSPSGYSAYEYSSNDSSLDVPATWMPSTPTTLATNSTWDPSTMNSAGSASDAFMDGLDGSPSLYNLEVAQWLSFAEIGREVAQPDPPYVPSEKKWELSMQDIPGGDSSHSRPRDEAT
ncbi:uncharacterized protein TRAVEDRAFT_47571 [Trametes versicolor FP-101664 SS1]|uniref:uncharacterized protein n=1 Tax=Trametes versicolor (strain FP-101664) TaxID=717944 RepID=UPI000462128B|nr:uncharacterized protein TRAVEDRAFT_47571 [Trametes versicolor FP-101664 SS1]EIW58418.1 hypothetical protein TRAVEDRAFT_47571 [Trametes versicolor FP-101664 SS1]